MSCLQISNFYRFHTLSPDHLDDHRGCLEQFGAELSLLGLIILAEEGINGSIVGDAHNVNEFEKRLMARFEQNDWDFKRAECPKLPFRSFRVKIRPEIVTSGDPELRIDSEAKKLSPDQWHEELSNFNPDDSILLDTRNVYETRIGMFREAVDPGISNFQEFDSYIREAAIPRSKKVYMYCTGGIRCEKASMQMKQLGYEEVFQLDGGILRYLEKYPNAHFVGDCFVFDGRVAVDQSLSPSPTWSFCPHCGDPACEVLQCRFCGTSTKVCEVCRTDSGKNTCSKNCSYQLDHHPSQKMNS